MGIESRQVPEIFLMLSNLKKLSVFLVIRNRIIEEKVNLKKSQGKLICIQKKDDCIGIRIG